MIDSKLLFLISSQGAVISGSSIPGQGYAYLTNRENNSKPTVVGVFVYNNGITWTQFQTYANVACKMAGYNGTHSSSLFGFYDQRWHYSWEFLNIWGCSGKEDSLLDCRYDLVWYQNIEYKIKLNCLPPGKFSIYSECRSTVMYGSLSSYFNPKMLLRRATSVYLSIETHRNGKVFIVISCFCFCKCFPRLLVPIICLCSTGI